MSYLNRMSPDLLRKRYSQLHRLLQQEMSKASKLRDRVELLEAENRELHVRLGDPPTETRSPP